MPLSLSKVQLLLAQLLGVELGRGALSDRRQRLSSTPEVVTLEAHQAAQQQPVADVDEIGVGAPRPAMRMAAIPKASAVGCG